MRSASGRLMPSTLAISSTAAACTPRRPPKCSISAWRRFAPMPGISLSIEVVRVFPQRAVADDRETVRLVANRLDEVQAGMRRRELQAARIGFDDQLLEARLALGALC